MLSGPKRRFGRCSETARSGARRPAPGARGGGEPGQATSPGGPPGTGGRSEAGANHHATSSRSYDAGAACVAGWGAPDHTGDRRDLRDLPGARLLPRARAGGRDRVVQLRGAEHPAGAPGSGHVGHVLPGRRRAAPQPHVTRSGSHHGDARSAGARGRSRDVLPEGSVRRDACARLRADRGAGGGRGNRLRGVPVHDRALRPSLLRRGHAHAIPPGVLPLHRAVRRG